LLDVTQSVIIANALTQGMFRANVLDFFTGRKDGKYVAGADGTARLTLPELLKGANIAPNWASLGVDSVPDVVMYNLKKHGIQMAATVILTPIAFNIAKKVLRKPLLTPANRMLKSAGLSSTVRV